MSTWSHPDPQMRRAHRVLRLVFELHKRGYQRIRVMTEISPSGFHWRCYISHIGNFLSSHGARIPSDTLVHCLNVARYSSASGNEYFGWTDAENDTAADLADKFIDRFPALAKLGYGQDWAYSGWYVGLLGHADRGYFPIVRPDHWGDDWDYDRHIRLTGTDDGLALPPAGEFTGTGQAAYGLVVVSGVYEGTNNTGA